MKLLNILTMIGLLFTPNLKPQTIQSVSSSATELNLLYYGNETVTNYLLSYFDIYQEVDLGYIYYGTTAQTQLTDYVYMFYPYNLGDTDTEYHTIFINFSYAGSEFNIDGNLFEFDILSFNSNPFTSLSNTFNTFYYNIDLMPFNYYLSSSSVPNIQQYDMVTCALTTPNVINTSPYTFLCLRFSKWYFSDYLDNDYVNSFNNTLYGYFSTNNGFQCFTSFYNPSFYVSPLYYNENNYNLGFQDGVNSVDTDFYYDNGYSVGYSAGYDNASSSFDTSIYYNEGFQDGADSVNTGAIYQNAFNDGYNAGLLESSHDYGITNLLYSIFNIPVLVLSNLLSFTIFGVEFWSVMISFVFLGLILFIIRMFIKHNSSGD